MFLLRRSGLCVFVLGVLFLTACSGGGAREWLKAPGWSHAAGLEETRIGDPVAMAVDEDGGVYLLFVTAVNDQLSPKITALNRQAEMVWERTLPVALSQPDKPAVIWDGQVLNLFWMADNSLYQAQMDTSGQLMMAPRLLSGDKIVDAYDAVLDDAGLLTVWYAGQRRDPGVFALLNGRLTDEPVLVDAEGIRPSLQFDTDGNLHAVWSHYPPGYSDTVFFYAVYAHGVYEPGQETAVYSPTLKPTDILSGPWLGMDGQKVYMVWNVSVRTGPEAGKILTEYLSFPPGQSGLLSGPLTVTLPGVVDLTYDYEPDAGFAAGKRVLSIDQYPRTTAVTDVGLVPANKATQELALAFDIIVPYEFRKKRGQIGTLFLKDGVVNGYQLLSFTPEASIAPSLIFDKAGYLYLTWLERGDEGGFQIHFTSTAPDMVQALSDLTWGDITRFSRDTAFGLLSGIALSPILVALWSLLPLVFLYATSFLRRGKPGKRVAAGTTVSLLLAVASYWVVKLATIPGIRSYVPFSVWIPNIPSWLKAPLQFGVPGVITIVGIVTAWHFTYRRDSESILNFLLIFAAVDGLLTMAVYGFQFYNVI